MHIYTFVKIINEKGFGFEKEQGRDYIVEFAERKGKGEMIKIIL